MGETGSLFSEAVYNHTITQQTNRMVQQSSTFFASILLSHANVFYFDPLVEKRIFIVQIPATLLYNCLSTKHFSLTFNKPVYLSSRLQGEAYWIRVRSVSLIVINYAQQLFR